jgi:hypothetical protein
MPYVDTDEAKAQRRANAKLLLGVFDPGEVEGLSEAIRNENFDWNVPFLGLDRTICGLPARPFSTRHVIWLSTVKSPFLARCEPEMFYGLPDLSHHCQRFLWIVSPQFRSRYFSGFRRKRKFKQVNKAFGRHGMKMIDEIVGYIDEAFADAFNASSRPSFCSVAATNVHRLCKQYGWPMDMALDCPIQIMFQLVQCMREDRGEKLTKRSDIIIAEYLEQENRKLFGNS